MKAPTTVDVRALRASTFVEAAGETTRPRSTSCAASSSCCVVKMRSVRSALCSSSVESRFVSRSWSVDEEPPACSTCVVTSSMRPFSESSWACCASRRCCRLSIFASA